MKCVRVWWTLGCKLTYRKGVIKNMINCLCFTCKGCNNEDYPCEDDIEDPCGNCSNGRTISCTGYSVK